METKKFKSNLNNDLIYYVIYDDKADKHYIAENLQNTGCLNSAWHFATAKEAEEIIKKYGWDGWASIMEINNEEIIEF